MKKEILYQQSLKQNGYLFTADVLNLGISKTYLASFVQNNHFEKVAHGVYLSPDFFYDELFVLQKLNTQIVFSDDVAFYLNGLSDREYHQISIHVPTGYNASHLRKKQILIKSEKNEIYELGKTTLLTNFGNAVTTYNAERCVCDAIKNRKKIEVQTFQTVLKEYMKSENKDLSTLVQYADKLSVRDEVMKYIEVLI